MKEQREMRLYRRYREILNESSHERVYVVDYPESMFDIRLVSKKDRKDALIDYSQKLMNEYFFFGNYSSAILLNEDVTHPSLQRLKNRLKRNYKIKDWQLDINKFCNDIEGYQAKRLMKEEVPICIPDIEKNREIIINVFEQEGYYLINEIPADHD